jgi:hypothetical protein
MDQTITFQFTVALITQKLLLLFGFLTATTEAAELIRIPGAVLRLIKFLGLKKRTMN